MLLVLLVACAEAGKEEALGRGKKKRKEEAMATHVMAG